MPAAGLMQHLLGPGTTRESAVAILNEALLSETDPLQWCATHFKLSDTEIMRRAATWSGFAFFDVVPRIGTLALDANRLDYLSQVRLYRVTLMDRDVVFAAPDFFGLLRLVEVRERGASVDRMICLVPGSALRGFLVSQAGPLLTDHARQNMTRYWPRAAAQLELTSVARNIASILIAAATVLLLLAPAFGQMALAPLWLLFVLAPALLRLASLTVPPDPDEPGNLPDEPADWPLYTVLVPLRDEANMVEQLYTWLGAFDYPAEKLEVLFLVEASSDETVRAVRQHLNDARFGLLVVPDAAPRTKPKALDFALPLCRGEYLVVYDAEDRPSPDQLRKAAGIFNRRPELACIQARLVIDNGGRHFLPSLFAGEYAGLFGVLLPALARWGLVTPLGGSSNHFRTEMLRSVGGWDAFNVTEDADLGVRLVRRGLPCATMSSATLEAAPRSLKAWFGQRTRWMKGWMQTYVVHTRHLPDLVSDLGLVGTVMFQVVLLGMLLAPLLHAGFLVQLLVLGVTGQLAWPLVEPWPLACLLVLLIGHGCAIASNLIGLSRTGQKGLWVWQILVPLYWLLIAGATIRALREFSLRPFHWYKTPHTETEHVEAPVEKPVFRQKTGAVTAAEGTQGANSATIAPG